MQRSIILAAFFTIATIAGTPVTTQAADPQVERGKYLVQIGGCTDCHTPGHFLGKPDMTRYLGGSDVGFGIPGMGVFVGPNLTSDKETGLGNWSARQIVTAIKSGTRPDGRTLAPSMPWRGLAGLTDTDALSIAAFLKSVPPVSHKIPGPFGVNETASVLVMTVVPGTAFSSATPPK
jgi:mono/diheme cytochrome c family protein